MTCHGANEQAPACSSYTFMTTMRPNPISTPYPLPLPLPLTLTLSKQGGGVKSVSLGIML